MKTLFRFLIAASLILLASQSFAADVNVTQTVVAVTTTTAAATSRATRRLLILQNISDAAISCKFGVAAVVSEGIVLNPAGSAGLVGSVLVFDTTVPTGALNCIHAGTGNKSLSIIEGN